MPGSDLAENLAFAAITLHNAWRAECARFCRHQTADPSRLREAPKKSPPPCGGRPRVGVVAGDEEAASDAARTIRRGKAKFSTRQREAPGALVRAFAIMKQGRTPKRGRQMTTAITEPKERDEPTRTAFRPCAPLDQWTELERTIVGFGFSVQRLRRVLFSMLTVHELGAGGAGHCVEFSSSIIADVVLAPFRAVRTAMSFFRVRICPGPPEANGVT